MSDLLNLAPPLGIAEVEHQRSAAVLALTAARVRREALLVDDDTDDAIAACDARADALHLLLERLDAAEITLRGRLLQAIPLHFENWKT
jgi:hypothetical protein